MDLGYAIQVLREKVADDSYEFTLAVEQKDEEIQERQKERLAILQDAMNALAKLSSVPQANELLPHVSGSALVNAKKLVELIREPIDSGVMNDGVAVIGNVDLYEVVFYKFLREHYR